MEASLRDRVIQALSAVLDPETSLDVWRMRLVRELEVGDKGQVCLTFRPSSPVCPMAFSLGAKIVQALQALEGVRRVQVRVEDFVHARQLDRLLREMDERRK